MFRLLQRSSAALVVLRFCYFYRPRHSHKRPLPASSGTRPAACCQASPSKRPAPR